MFEPGQLDQLDDDGTAIDDEEQLASEAAHSTGLRRATSEAARVGAFSSTASIIAPGKR